MFSKRYYYRSMSTVRISPWQANGTHQLFSFGSHNSIDISCGQKDFPPHYPPALPTVNTWTNSQHYSCVLCCQCTEICKMAAEDKQETKQMSNWVPLNQDGGSVGLVGAVRWLIQIYVHQCVGVHLKSTSRCGYANTGVLMCIHVCLCNQHQQTSPCHKCLLV